MIWGEIIQELRLYHHALIDHAPALRKPHSLDLQLVFPESLLPKPTGEMMEWSDSPIYSGPNQLIEPDLADWLELHPVERALIEGPLLPIQQIRFASTDAFSEFIHALIELETKWLLSIRGLEHAPKNWEIELRGRILKLQNRAGLTRLRQA
jgi:hypothetical protein